MWDSEWNEFAAFAKHGTPFTPQNIRGMLKRTTREKGYALEILEEQMTPNPGGEQVAVTFRFRKLAPASKPRRREQGEGTPGRDSSNGAAICANRQKRQLQLEVAVTTASAASERESRFCFQEEAMSTMSFTGLGLIPHSHGDFAPEDNLTVFDLLCGRRGYIAHSMPPRPRDAQLTRENLRALIRRNDGAARIRGEVSNAISRSAPQRFRHKYRRWHVITPICNSLMAQPARRKASP